MYLQLRQNTMHCARWLLRFLWIRCELGQSVLCRMELFLGCGAVQALRMRSERALWRAEHGVLPTLSLSSVPWTPWDPWSELRLPSSSPSLYLNRSLIWGIKSFVVFFHLRVYKTISAPTMAASAKRKQEEKHLKMLREMTSLLPNRKCFDCDQRGPTYANMTNGSFVCTSCSGIL